MVTAPGRTTRRRPILAVLAVLALGLGLAAASPAAAEPVPASPAATPAPASGFEPPTRPGHGGGGNNGQQARIRTYQVGNGTACTMIASPRSVGGICVSARAFDGPTIGELLDGDPLPHCWHERLDEQDLYDLNLHHGNGMGWYWVRCLEGIDPETFEIEPGGVWFRIAIWPYEDDDPALTTLTPNQQAVVDRFMTRGNVPDPVLLTSPSPAPWVNDDVAFYNFGETELEVSLAAPGVQMRGRVTEMIIYPEGRDGESITCDGAGVQAEPGDTPITLPDACWYSYDRASLARPEGYFDAEIHLKWQIDVRIDGTWQPFHEFTKSSSAMIQVNEVQAVVRP